MGWYRRLWRIENMPIPVRDRKYNVGISPGPVLSAHGLVPTTLVYPNNPSTSERPEVQCEYLTGSGVLMRWYHRLWYARNPLVPVRYYQSRPPHFTSSLGHVGLARAISHSKHSTTGGRLRAPHTPSPLPPPQQHTPWRARTTHPVGSSTATCAARTLAHKRP